MSRDIPETILFNVPLDLAFVICYLLFVFTGRDRPRSSQDGSAHGTPGRMDGQPRCRPDGITSHEEKKHYHDGNFF